MFIYKIENKVNGKVYIGKTRRTDVTVRWKEHIDSLMKNTHYNQYLQNSWNKHGHDKFSFTILAKYPDDFDEVELANEEIKYIDKFDSFRNGYNLTVRSEGDIEPKYFKYKIYYSKITSAGNQSYVIFDRNGNSLISSTNKELLEDLISLLNENESEGLKQIRELDRFVYVVVKAGFTREGKQNYMIYSREHTPLIRSIDYEFLESFVTLLNEDESKGLKAIEEAKINRVGSFKGKKHSDESKLKMSRARQGKWLNNKNKCKFNRKKINTYAHIVKKGKEHGKTKYAIIKNGKHIKQSNNYAKLLNWFTDKYLTEILVIKY